MAQRTQSLLRHLCIGEMENRSVNVDLENPGHRTVRNHHPLFRYRFVREIIKIVFEDKTASDERYGGSGDKAILEGELIRPSTKSSCVVVFMHPSGIQNLLPMPVAMARAGVHVVTCCSRYPNNDSCLIMEKVALDLGACVRHLRKKLGYRTVILAGWSGGGSLSAFYQAQAELGENALTHTPAGDAVDLRGLPLADGLMVLAAHTSRARILTEWIDPAVIDEHDPSKRDATLDLYAKGNAPPFSAEFVKRYRDAQITRNRRITAWVRAELEALEARASSGGVCDDEAGSAWRHGERDRGFVVHGTQADPRRVDTLLEPNARPMTDILSLARENHSPVGLARFTTLRSWLSQWSYDSSNADGPRSLRCVSVPVLVLVNGADHLVPPSHPAAMYAAVPHQNKELVIIEGASHYYFGETEKMAEGVTRIITWLRSKLFLEPYFLDDDTVTCHH